MAPSSMITMAVLVVLNFFNGLIITGHDIDKHTYTVMCYIQSWSKLINSNQGYNVSFFDANLCTHVVYLRVELNNKTYEIQVRDTESEIGETGKFLATTALKAKYQHLKVLVNVGGWISEKYVVPYETMINSPTHRQVFVNSVVDFIRKYNFDGIEVDFRHLNTNPTIKNADSFVALLQELNAAFSKNQWILTVMISDVNNRSNVYNMQKISSLVNFINILTYDLWGHWNDKTGHNSPLYAGKHSLKFNVNETVLDYISLGADHAKINIGLPFYGRTFTLTNLNGILVGASSTKQPATIKTQLKFEPGLLPYSKLCTLISETWCIKRDYESHVPYASDDNRWISYDDTSSITDKAIYVVKNHLNGVMLYAISMDDIGGKCHGRSMHLLKTVNEVFEKEYKKGSKTLPAFVLDPSQFQNNRHGNLKVSNCAFFTSSAVIISFSILISLYITLY